MQIIYFLLFSLYKVFSLFRYSHTRFAIWRMKTSYIMSTAHKCCDKSVFSRTPTVFIVQPVKRIIVDIVLWIFSASTPGFRGGRVVSVLTQAQKGMGSNRSRDAVG